MEMVTMWDQHVCVSGEGGVPDLHHLGHDNLLNFGGLLKQLQLYMHL